MNYPLAMFEVANTESEHPKIPVYLPVGVQIRTNENGKPLVDDNGFFYQRLVVRFPQRLPLREDLLKDYFPKF